VRVECIDYCTKAYSAPADLLARLRGSKGKGGKETGKERREKVGEEERK